ncbi:MAG: HEAT repeat domain-containing protein [Planctomycetota bacterium]|jgi:HEAT repeat protein
MLNRKSFTVFIVLGLLIGNVVLAETLKDNWSDFLHYTKIGRLDLAKGYAQLVIDSNPNPVELLKLYNENPHGAALLLRVNSAAPDAELVRLSGEILKIIEKGKFEKRAEPGTIAEEVRRLSRGARPKLAAIKRLKNAGEYAIPFMLDAMADKSRKEELPNIIWALPEVGKDAIRPLAAALQSDNVAIKSEIVKALARIGYPQSLPYLKYILEKDDSADLRRLATESIVKIDPSAVNTPAAALFYQLADSYYYHAESLAPAEKGQTANVWFWDTKARQLVMEKVDARYFYELMTMRCCEWALKADANFGRAIGLWMAAFYKAESANKQMPAYFGAGHADALTYATTAGPEYLHQALARAIKDKNAYVALGAIEALAVNAGESSLLYRLEIAQPLIDALSFDNKAVRYSAAIAIAAAGPKQKFPESKYIIRNLAQALTETGDDQELANAWISEDYPLRALKVMLQSAQTRNAVVNIPLAKNVLIGTAKNKRPEIQTLVAEILAYVDSPDAQRAITDQALAEDTAMDIRISAFNSLSLSAKINANMLDEGRINAIYSLVGSQETDPALRSAAAGAYGSLNLPSRKVKDLILDQSKS